MLYARGMYGFYVAELPQVHRTSILGMNPNCLYARFSPRVAVVLCEAANHYASDTSIYPIYSCTIKSQSKLTALKLLTELFCKDFSSLLRTNKAIPAIHDQLPIQILNQHNHTTCVIKATPIPATNTRKWIKSVRCSCYTHQLEMFI